MTTADVSIDGQVAKVFEWRRGFNALHLIDIGLKLGIFRALAEAANGLATEELTQKLGLRQRFVDVWCKTAYSFTLLEANNNGRFVLGPFFDKVLATPGHPRYLGGYVRLGTEFATEDFRRSVDAFRSGEHIAFQGRGPAFVAAIAESTVGLQVYCAKKILPELPGLAKILNAGGSLLEVGSGSGNHLIQVAKAFPGCRCIGVEIDPASHEAAAANVRTAGMVERIELHQGDVDQAVAAGSVDVVVMIEVLHEIAQNLRPKVIAACARALKAGGWLVIIDETYPATLEDTRKSEFFFPVQTGFEELLWGNVIPTREEQEELLRNAGFSGPIQRSVVGAGFTLLTTQRSA